MEFTISERNKSLIVILAFSSLFTGLCIFFLSGYLITDFVIWSALLLSPYIIYPDQKAKGKTKYLWLSLAFIVLAFTTKVLTFYFFGSVLAILFIIENMAGNIGTLPLFLTGLLSPTFRYFNNLFGFPVRLQLSEWAGKILNVLGQDAQVTGNVILLKGTEFSVDPACVGLKMMAVSVFCGILIIAFFQRENKFRFTFASIALIMIAIAILNIFSNLLRIIILTMFRILPDNPNHDFIGIACLMVYIIIPSYFIIKFFSRRRFSRSEASVKESTNMLKSLSMAFIIFVLLVVTGFTRLNSRTVKSADILKINLPEYSQKIVNGDILKLEKPGILAYVKPIQRFYGAEHNPMICWIGSGYEFGCIKIEIIDDKEIYTGILKKGNEKLYSAWWFDDGKEKTIKQLDWRWRSLKGDDFYLINVSCESKDVLLKEIRFFLEKNLFKIASLRLSGEEAGSQRN